MPVGDHPHQDHPLVDTAVETLGGTPADLDRAPVTPAVFVLPEPLARRVRAFDALVDDYFEHLRERPGVDRMLYGASTLGDFSLVWHLVGVGRALRSPAHEREAVRLAVALAVESVVINGMVKNLFRRTRPEWEQHRPRKLRRPRSSSFPSGHATSGFMAATLLVSRRPRTRPVWFALATVVAASRIHVRIHHASDVVAGAAIGVGLGRLARRVWRL